MGSAAPVRLAGWGLWLLPATVQAANRMGKPMAAAT